MAHRGRTVLAMDCALGGAEWHRGRPLNWVVRQHQLASDAKEMAQAWVTYWKHHEATGEFPNSVVESDVSELARESPAEALEVIFEILRTIDARPESELFQVLAAGPVEDLLGYSGSAVIEKVEEAAARDPSFKLLLGGVWKGQMSQDIWERVERARGEMW